MSGQRINQKEVCDGDVVSNTRDKQPLSLSLETASCI